MTTIQACCNRDRRRNPWSPPLPAPSGGSDSPLRRLSRCAGGPGRIVVVGGVGVGVCRAAMMEPPSLHGATATYAKEMERLSAKESLLLAFKDAGGFESLVTGKTTEMQKIDVNERIVALERLNPTPRSTTSPFLEGIWNFEWFGSGSPGLVAARFLSERFPSTLANLLGLDMLVKDGYAKITANLKFLNSIESKFLLTTRLSIEGPVRFKEEYVEGFFQTPTVIGQVIPEQVMGMVGQAIPEQVKGVVGRAADGLQQLPAPIKDALANGLRVPLGGSFHRMFLISYLDEEILIIRDSQGAPDVLTRVDMRSLPASVEPESPDYES